MIDPTGNDALWVKHNNKIRLVIPVNFTGSGATNASNIINKVNSLKIGNPNFEVSVIETDEPIHGVLNTMDLSAGYDFNNYPGAGEGAEFAGNKAHINTDNNESDGAAAHDMFHFAGVEDQYVEGPKDPQGNRTSTPTPGYDDSNIMTSRTGTELKGEQLQEAYDHRNEYENMKVCTSDGHGGLVCEK